jgi:hypothetical protein
MANIVRITLIACASLASANCSDSRDVGVNVAEPVIRVSVTRIPGIAGYVHVLAANPGSQEFTWEIADARYSDVTSGPNCEPTLRLAFARRDDSGGPEFILHSLVTLKPDEWQARTLPVPEQLLGMGCILDLYIGSSSGGREFAMRRIEVPLIEGFFEPAPRAISTSPDIRVQSAFVRNQGWYLIQVLAQARTQASLSVDWPRDAKCPNGNANVAFEAAPLNSLPDRHQQRVAPEQWAIASIALRTQDGGPPPQETCSANMTITFADPQSTSWTTQMPVKLSRSPHTFSSSFPWSGCPGCGRTLQPDVSR